MIFSDNQSMIGHALEFYKTLFGAESRPNIKLDERFWEEEKVTSR
jgi:hypothetical protein